MGFLPPDGMHLPSRLGEHERVLLLCKVAVGRSFITRANMAWLTNAPSGFHSVHGETGGIRPVVNDYLGCNQLDLTLKSLLCRRSQFRRDRDLCRGVDPSLCDRPLHVQKELNACCSRGCCLLEPANQISQEAW